MTEKEAARRYRWFCAMGYKKPILNDPLVISGDATPDYIDALIQDGMKRWPMKTEPQYPPEPDFPRVA